MSNLKAAQDKFRSTRVEAIAAYKEWQNAVSNNNYMEVNNLLLDYEVAWQKHQEASMALFLLEAEQ